jgi:hypothetical protein
VLGTFFLPWSVTSRPAAQVVARVRQRNLGDCRYVECSSSPISGQRSSGEIGRTRGDCFNLLYVVSGMEVLKFQGREILLPRNHFVLWDSGRRMDFQVLQNLEKLTLIIPEKQMRAILPNAEDYVGVPVVDTGGMERLFTDHLSSLRREIWNLKGADLDRLRSEELDLLVRAYASVPCRRRRADSAAGRRGQSHLDTLSAPAVRGRGNHRSPLDPGTTHCALQVGSVERRARRQNDHPDRLWMGFQRRGPFRQGLPAQCRNVTRSLSPARPDILLRDGSMTLTARCHPE